MKYFILALYLLAVFFTVFIVGNTYRFTSLLHAFGGINLIPFKDKIHYIQYDTRVLNNTTFIVKEIVGNLLLLFPLPLILVLLYEATSKMKVIAASFLLSCVIEATQMLTGLGNADIDDVILNTLGAVGGTFLAFRLKKYRHWPSIKTSLRLH